MPVLEPVPIGGLASLDDDNLIGFDQALLADDCTLDTQAIVGRNGYRSLTAAAILGSGVPQFLGRFRPSAASARIVAVVNGHILLITDASSDTASDGAVTDLGAVFGTTAAISGAQLASNFYLGADDGTCLQRIDVSYVLHPLCGLPAAVAPTAALGGQLTWTAFTSLAAPTVSGCVLQTNASTGFSGMASTWRGFTKTNNGNDDPANGSYAAYKLASTFDASGCDWLAVTVSPHTQDRFAYYAWNVEIQCAVDVAGSPGTWQTVGNIYDTPGDGAPNLVFCDLRTLDSTTRIAIRWMRFYLTWISQSGGNSGGKFITYGFMFLPSQPADPPPFTYYVDLFDPATGTQSDLSPPLVVNGTNASFASYPDSYMQWGQPTNTGGQDNLFGGNKARNFNLSAPLALPTQEQIGQVVTISGNVPAFSGFASVTVRLWKDTSSGRRLVGSQAGVTTGGAYSITDNGALGVLANQLYAAQGNAPLLSALGAHAGRLIAGQSNRAYISSFTPTSDTTNPVPQWPAIALEDADGWSYDVSPAPTEQIKHIDGEGDAVYIATQKTVYALSDLTPGTVPYLVYKRGCLGRQAMLYAEDVVFWAANDGVYQASNVSDASEMSQDVRRLYVDWLLPNTNVCIGYQSRKLYVFQDTRFLRYDFVKRHWTRGTLNDTVRMVLSYTDPDGTADRMLLLCTSRLIGRWLPSVARDMIIGTNAATGAAIPAWQYGTGFTVSPEPVVLKGLLLDATGDITFTEAKTVTAPTSPNQMRQFTVTKDNTLPQDESWTPCPSDFRMEKMRLQFSGANTTVLRRALFERQIIDEAKGG
jgi:hypothetical protein